MTLNEVRDKMHEIYPDCTVNAEGSSRYSPWTKEKYTEFHLSVTTKNSPTAGNVVWLGGSHLELLLDQALEVHKPTDDEAVALVEQKAD